MKCWNCDLLFCWDCRGVVGCSTITPTGMNAEDANGAGKNDRGRGKTTRVKKQCVCSPLSHMGKRIVLTVGAVAVLPIAVASALVVVLPLAVYYVAAPRKQKDKFDTAVLAATGRIQN